MANLIIRPALRSDLPQLTEIYNYYVTNTHITFDVNPCVPEQRVAWFDEHSDGVRYRLLVAEDPNTGILGYATTGRFRPKPAYDTTVEVSIACSHAALGSGVGSRLYSELFASLQDQDIHRIVAGIAQPNQRSNALHAKFGFTPVGTFTRVGRKFGKYWDVLWLERPLILNSPH